jgi:hypothetical protein
MALQCDFSDDDLLLNRQIDEWPRRTSSWQRLNGLLPQQGL